MLAIQTDQRLTSLYVPLAPSDYRQCREYLIAEERARRCAGWTKKAKPTDKALEKDMKDFLATLPERLADALAVDTADLQAVGWSDPPTARRVLYAAPELTTAWRGERLREIQRKQPDPTVARFVLAGRPRPRVEDTLRIAEIMRLAAMAKFGWTIVDGKRRPNAPSVISGYGDDGKPLRHDGHAHAFWLPEDADSDGAIDHLIVYAPAGLDRDCRKALDLVTKLWTEKSARGDDEEEAADSGHKEWRLALEGFGQPLGERVLQLLEHKDMDIDHALPHALAREEGVRMGRADRARIEGARLAEFGRASPRAWLHLHWWSRETAYPLPPLPLTPQPETARYAWTLPATDI